MTPNPLPAPPPAQKKKSGSSGCLIVLAIIGGLLVIACLVGSVAMWRVSQSEEGKKVFSAIGKGVQIAEKGMNAPGTAELRNAGCPQALVLDVEDVMGMVDIFIDGGARREPIREDAIVMCQGNVFDSLPDCAELSGVYIAAAHPQRPFVISVRKQGDSKPVCERRYSPEGTELEANKK